MFMTLVYVLHKKQNFVKIVNPGELFVVKEIFFLDQKVSCLESPEMYSYSNLFKF